MIRVVHRPLIHGLIPWYPDQNDGGPSRRPLPVIPAGTPESRPGMAISSLKSLVETWVEAHETELLEQWENARHNGAISIVG